MLDVRQMNSFNSLCNKFLADLPANRREEATVTLYAFTDKTSAIKQINLENLSLEALRKYEEQNSLVVVVATSNTFVAFMNNHRADQYKQGDTLTISGKAVTVKGLSDAEYDELKQISEMINAAKELSMPNGKRHETTGAPSIASYERIQQGLSTIQRENTFLQFVAKITDISHGIKRKLLEAWAENRKQIAEAGKEKDQKDQVKSLKIKHTELRKQRLKDDVENREIEAQEFKKQTKKSEI